MNGILIIDISKLEMLDGDSCRWTAHIEGGEYIDILELLSILIGHLRHDISVMFDGEEVL